MKGICGCHWRQSMAMDAPRWRRMAELRAPAHARCEAAAEAQRLRWHKVFCGVDGASQVGNRRDGAAGALPGTGSGAGRILDMVWRAFRWRELRIEMLFWLARISRRTTWQTCWHRRA